MERPPLEVADIFCEFKDEYLKLYGESTSFEQRKAIRDICQCRTAVLGGHIWQCPDCGAEDQSYNSCRNRNCNKCQGKDIINWLAKREKELLATHYFHLVFTLPHQFSALALQNQKLV